MINWLLVPLIFAHPCIASGIYETIEQAQSHAELNQINQLATEYHHLQLQQEENESGPYVTFNSNYSHKTNTYNHTSSNPKKLSAQLTQTLYDPTRKHKIKTAKLDYAEARIYQKKHEQQLSFQVLEHCLELGLKQHQLALLQKEAELTKSLLKKTKRSYDLGITSKQDLLVSQANLHDIETQILETQLHITKQASNLQRLSGSPPTHAFNLHLTPDIVSFDEKKALDTALKYNFDLLHTTIQIKKSIQQLKLAQQMHAPTLNLNTDIEQQFDSNTHPSKKQSYGANVALSIPLYTHGRKSTEISQRKKIVQTKKTELLDRQKTLSNDIQQQIQTIALNQEKHKSSKKSESAHQLAYLATLANFELGSASLNDLLTEQHRLYRAKINSKEIEYQQLKAKSLLLLMMGKFNTTYIKAIDQQFLAHSPEY